MAYTIKISELASRSLEELAAYIAQDDPYRALSFTKDLLNSVEKTLRLFPYSSRSYKKYSVYTYKGYCVFYLVDEDRKQVNIIDIINPSQYTKHKIYNSE